jgi:hypothetical protein
VTTLERPDRQEQHRSASHGDQSPPQDIVIGVAGFVIGVAGLITGVLVPVFPPGAARAGLLIYVPVVLAFSFALAWFSYRLVTSLLAKRIQPRKLLRASIASAILLVPLLYTAPGPEESLGRRGCNLGPWGIWKGTVWFKVVPPPQGGPNEARMPQEYTIDMVWGPARVHRTVTLGGPTYFAFKQHDLKSPGADITVTPQNGGRPGHPPGAAAPPGAAGSALISCGFGRPPTGATRIDLTGDDFIVSR